ncbi:hypothetical protein HN748_05985 [Candidatus Peregrinibacteria bacterium]|jgi:hypothetical protein|nr:hypothetical protein [Candidatus Peregrinibacteria bacterium]MBT7703755.1 hypothetical protein [Candidatus Peregrinibacteria bacterium]
MNHEIPQEDVAESPGSRDALLTQVMDSLPPDVRDVLKEKVQVYSEIMVVVEEQWASLDANPRLSEKERNELKAYYLLLVYANSAGVDLQPFREASLYHSKDSGAYSVDDMIGDEKRLEVSVATVFPSDLDSVDLTPALRSIRHALIFSGIYIKRSGGLNFHYPPFGKNAWPQNVKVREDYEDGVAEYSKADFKYVYSVNGELVEMMDLLLEIDPLLMPSEPQSLFSASMNFDYEKDGLRLRVYNLFNPEDPILWERFYGYPSLGDDGSVSEKDVYEWQQAVLDEMAAFYEELDVGVLQADFETLPQVEINHGIADFNILSLQEEGLDLTSQRFYEDFFALGGRYVVVPIVDKKELERISPGFLSSRFGSYPGSFVTNGERSEEAVTAHPLCINGQAFALVFDYFIESEDFEEYKDMEGEYKDKYGNNIYVNIISSESQTQMRVKVYCPFVYAEEGEEDVYVPVSVDLEGLDLPEGLQGRELTNIVYVKAQQPAYRTGGVFEDLPDYDLKFYTNVRNEEEFNGAIAEGLDVTVAKGAIHAEMMWGYEPGDLIWNVNVVEARYMNAFYYHANPHSIFFQDEILDIHHKDLEAVTYHEAIHLIDRYLGITDEGAFKDWYDELRQGGEGDFFQMLKEEEFLSAIGGHPWDNEAELLASFLNSFNHPEWEETIATTSDEFISFYYDGLLALEARLGEIGLPEEAPLWSIIDEKREYIDCELLAID